MTLLSQTQYAKHRGISVQRVSELKRQGRLILNGKKVEVEETDKALDLQLATYRGGQAGGSRSAAARAQDAASANGGDEMAAARERLRQDDGFPTLAEAVRMKEVYLARLRQLEFETESKKLVPAAQVERTWGQAIAVAREHLLHLPYKLAERALLCKTPAEMEKLLRNEIHDALRSLSEVTFEASDDGDDNGKANGGSA